MSLIEQAGAQVKPGRCAKCNKYLGQDVEAHRDSQECIRGAEEREIYRAGWIKLTDLPDWEVSAYLPGLEDWWPRRVIQKFNVIYGRGAIILKANPRMGYTSSWVRVWAVQVLMERMRAVDADPEGQVLDVDEGVALLKAYYDAFRDGADAADMKRPDEIAVHLAGNTPIPDWIRFGWFRAWLELGHL